MITMRAAMVRSKKIHRFECPLSCGLDFCFVESVERHLQKVHETSKSKAKALIFWNDKRVFSEEEMPRLPNYHRAWKSHLRFKKDLRGYLIDRFPTRTVENCLQTLLELLAELCLDEAFLPHRIFELQHHGNTLPDLKRLACFINSRYSPLLRSIFEECITRFLDYIKFWVERNDTGLSRQRCKQLLELESTGVKMFAEPKTESPLELEASPSKIIDFAQSSFCKDLFEDIIQSPNPDFVQVRDTLLYALMFECGLPFEDILGISMNDYKGRFFLKDYLVIHSCQETSSGIMSESHLLIRRGEVERLLYKYVKVCPPRYWSTREFLFVTDGGSKMVDAQSAILKLERDIIQSELVGGRYKLRNAKRSTPRRAVNQVLDPKESPPKKKKMVEESTRPQEGSISRTLRRKRSAEFIDSQDKKKTVV